VAHAPVSLRMLLVGVKLKRGYDWR